MLVCLGKAVTYRPSDAIFRMYTQQHPETFQHEWERLGDPLPLNPDTHLQWKDLRIWGDYGVAAGDVYAAQQLTVAFARMQKESQLRIGQDYEYADLRRAPSVLVGAFNNRYSMQMSSSLPFHFDEQAGEISINEVGGARRRWVMNKTDDHRLKDYAVAARLLNANTGNFVLILGGLGANGTQAATELVTDPHYLNTALRTLPRDWRSHNIAFVLSTTVTDDVAGPPSIVASSVW